MIERRGYVLVVASVAAVVHAPGLAAYAASKAGVEAFSDSLRTEVTHLGVDVGVGYFHWIDTDMVRGADAHPAMEDFRAQTSGPAGQDLLRSRRSARPSPTGSSSAAAGSSCPAGSRGLLVLRGVLGPLIDRGAKDAVPEVDAAFERDIAERGAEAVSAPVGAGGAGGSEARPAGRLAGRHSRRSSRARTKPGGGRSERGGRQPASERGLRQPPFAAGWRARGL